MMLSVFSQTLLCFTGRELTVDLRKPIDQASRERLGTLGLGRHFCVITADNPFGRAVVPEENSSRCGQLEDELDRLGCLHVPCVGMNPEQTHRENGFAAAINLADAIAIARTFEQLALFHYDGVSFWIVPVLLPGAHVQLPLAR